MRIILKRQLHVHAIHTGNESRKHQDNRNRCEKFHRSIEIIRNNRGKSIRNIPDEASIDFHRFESLFIFIKYIFKKLFIILNTGKKFSFTKFFNHDLI